MTEKQTVELSQNMTPKVAIIYLSYHPEPYIEKVTAALEKMTYPKDNVELVVVDNPHPEFGSAKRFLEEKVMPLSGNVLSHVTLIINEKNLGFAGGNNVGIKWAIENGFDYVFLLNNDAFPAPGFLEPLIGAMEADKKIGAGQSLLMLAAEPILVNSAGNVMHYLGFGYCWGYRQTPAELNLPPIKEIGYASGACLLMRVDVLKQYGGLDEDFFLYHEDLEYSYRLKSLGYKIVLARDSVVYHQYEFSRSVSKYFWMERNRYAVILMFYKLPTLILLLPTKLVVEIGLILMSIKGGWFKERLAVYRYWANLTNWPLWLKKRRIIQSRRAVSDRVLLKEVVSKILFQDDSVKNPLLVYVGNPLMKGYWWVVKKIILW